MSYNVCAIRIFEKQIKRLSKKFPSLKAEYIALVKDLKENPHKGIPMRDNCFKIKLAVASKGRGKSGGARVVTHFYVENETVFLLTIYDKSEQADISDKELKGLLSEIEY